MSLGGEGDFRLPLPDAFIRNPADWEEWAWNFKAYISMFETGAVMQKQATMNFSMNI